MADIEYRLTVKDDGTPVLKKFSGSIEDSDKKVGKLSKTLGAGKSAFSGFGSIVGLVAGGAMVAYAKSVFNVMDSQRKFSEQVGISARSVAGLNYAATLGGSSIEGMQKSMVKLSKALTDTNEGARAFEAIGVATKDAEGNIRGVDEVIFDVADKFSKMKDGAAKTSVALQLFGKSGAELIPTLNQGGDAVRRLAEEGANLQGINEGTMRSMEDFNDSLTRLQAGATGLVATIASALQPQIKAFSDGISQWAKDISERVELSRNIEAQNQQKAYAEAKINAVKHGNEIKMLQERISKATTDDKRYYLQQQIESFERSLKKEKEITEKYESERKQAAIKAEDDKQKAIQARRAASGIEKPQGSKKSDPTLGGIIANMEAWNESIDQRIAGSKEIADAEDKRLQEIRDNEQKYSEQNAEADRLEMQRTQAIYEYQFTKEEEFAKKREEDEKAYIKLVQEEAQDRMDSMSAIGQTAGNLNQTISNYNALQISQIRDKYNKEREEIISASETQMNQAGITAARKQQIQEETDKKIADLDKKQEKETRATQKKTFEVQKQLSTIEAGMNTAVAFTKALTAAPPPFNIALAASVAALGATQIALIQSQKFATGGEPIGRNAVVQMNEGGQEAVLNPTAYKTAGSGFVGALNSGASMDQALASITSGTRGINVTLNVTGFIGDQGIADYITSTMTKKLKRMR